MQLEPLSGAGLVQSSSDTLTKPRRVAQRYSTSCQPRLVLGHRQLPHPELKDYGENITFLFNRVRCHRGFLEHQ